LVLRHRLLITAVFAVVLGGSAIAAAASGTHTESGDTAAASAYLASRYALLRDANAELPTIGVAIHRAVARVSSGCPGALSKAPRGREFNAFDREVGLALTLVTFHVRVRALTTFTEATKSLRWKERAFTNLVRASAAQNEAEVRLRFPDVCAGVREWATSGYHTVPAPVIRFLNVTTEIANMTSGEEQALGGPLESSDEIINRMLRQHLLTQERALMRHVEALEGAVSGSEERLVVAGIARLRVALGIGPASNETR
jgi:hypothetical protein